jgi:hypothetical protein
MGRVAMNPAPVMVQHKFLSGNAYHRALKKISGIFRPASGADTEKVQPVIQNLKIRFERDLPFHFIDAIEIRVGNAFALDADNVGMGFGLVAVIPVAPVRKPQLKDLTERLDQDDIPVNRGKAHGRKVSLNPVMDILGAGVALTSGQNAGDGQPLGGDLVAAVPQFPDDDFKSFVMVRH